MTAAETDEEIREKHRKHIAEISADLEDDYLGTSEDERNEERQAYIIKTLGESAAQLTKDQFEQVLIDKYHFKATKDTEELYYYDGRKYVKGGEWLINQECLVFNPGIHSAIVEQIRNHIVWANYVDRSEFDSQIEWICCKNVMVNLLTGDIKPHNPEFMATVEIPHNYTISKGSLLSYPPKIWKFLCEVVGYSNAETILDFMAYCLWKELPFHRWLLFNGSGRNGKGVTTQLITCLLGRKNVSNETLHRILETRFATAKLYGKMANIDADMSSQALKHTGMLKMLTGGDDIPAENKFKPPFSFKNYAKLIFSANTIPLTPDESDAFFARLIIINFTKQFLGNKANPKLIEELTTDSEMSALLSVLIRRLPLVLKNGISYADTHTIEDNYLKYMRSSDPIRYFAETALRKDDEVNAYELKTTVHDAYIRFCNENKLSIESAQTFSRRLKKEGYHDIQIRKKGAGRDAPRDWVWRNVKLVDWKKVEDEGQDVLEV